MQITKLHCKRVKENTAEIWRAFYLAAWKDYYRLHHKLKLLELKEEDLRPSLASPVESRISVNKPLSLSALAVKKCFWNRGVCCTTLFLLAAGLSQESKFSGMPFSLFSFEIEFFIEWTENSKLFERYCNVLCWLYESCCKNVLGSVLEEKLRMETLYLFVDYCQMSLLCC